MTLIKRKALHIAVIGAGIMGASFAWRIATHGARVTLIDKGAPGSGASSHSFAWINAGSKEPIGYHNLNRYSLERWSRFAAAISEDGDETRVGLRWGGKVSWESDATAAERLKAQVQQLQLWGYPTRLIDAARLSELEPSLEVGEVAAAEYSRNEGQVEPQLAVDACLRRLAEMEAAVHAHTEVVGFALDGDGRIAAVQTASGDIECDAVVLAAGTDTTALAGMAGAHVPQARSPGVVIRTTPVEPLLQNVPVIYAPALGEGRQEIHIRQCADGRMMIGEGNQESLAEDDSQEHADDLLERACHYLPGLAGAKAIPVPVGWRPMPLDGYPIMGFTPECANLYIALTHSGVTLAPIISHLAAWEICDAETRDGELAIGALVPYRPQRFSRS